jgi:hypothetical protein
MWVKIESTQYQDGHPIFAKFSKIAITDSCHSKVICVEEKFLRVARLKIVVVYYGQVMIEKCGAGVVFHHTFLAWDPWDTLIADLGPIGLYEYKRKSKFSFSCSNLVVDGCCVHKLFSCMSESK